MSMKPLRDFILVSKTPDEEKTASGLIYKPATVENKVVQGTVVAVGSGRVTSTGSVVPLEVKVGDVVHFNKNMATELTDGTDAVLLLREESVFCVSR